MAGESRFVGTGDDLKLVKPEKPGKLSIDFLIVVEVSGKIYAMMDEHDRQWLNDLRYVAKDMRQNPIDIGDRTDRHFILRLEDVLRVRNLLRKYNTVLTYPESSKLQKYGLKHSAKDSLEIFHDGDVYEVRQYYPNGQISTYRIPKDIVEQVYKVILKIFTDRPDLEKIESKDLWEPLCREFDLQRYFDWRGRFHSNSFFGDRSQYFRFFYYPCRILSHLTDGRIIYKGPVITLPADKRKTALPPKPRTVVHKTLKEYTEPSA